MNRIILFKLIIIIISNGVNSVFYESSEAIFNWERPNGHPASLEQFSDEDELLLKQLSKGRPGTYRYKPSTSLQMVSSPSREESEEEESDDENDSVTLAEHLTKLAASSSNNNYQSSSALTPLGHGSTNSYTPMDVIPFEYLKYIKDLDGIDTSILNGALNRKKKSKSNTALEKLPLADGRVRKRKQRKKSGNEFKTQKKSYYDEDDMPEDGSDINPHHTSNRKSEEGLKVVRRVPVPNWTYEDEDKWGKSFSSCEGINQSPINIHPKSIVEETGLSLLFMNSYRTILEKAHLVNNGRTVEVEYKGGPRPAVTGSALLDDVYMFQQLHFHWGSKNTIGSEHAVFGQKFAMELHLVHYNEKYGSFEAAAGKPDGLAVIAVFFQVSSKDNPRFDDLVNSLREVQCGGDMIDFNHKMSVSFLLPSNRGEFYRYSGSLTTPPCTESVTWIILKHGLLIGRNQLKMFRNLKQGDCKSPILNNWRNIQAVNGRKVDKTSVSFHRPVLVIPHFIPLAL